MNALVNFFAGMGATAVMVALFVQYNPVPHGEIVQGCAVPSDGSVLMLRVQQYKGKLLANCSYLPRPAG